MPVQCNGVEIYYDIPHHVVRSGKRNRYYRFFLETKVDNGCLASGRDKGAMTYQRWICDLRSFICLACGIEALHLSYLMLLKTRKA